MEFSVGFSAVYYEGEPCNPIFMVVDVNPLKAKKKAEKFCRKMNVHLRCDACRVSNQEVYLPFREDAEEHAEILRKVDRSLSRKVAAAASAVALKTGKAAKKATSPKKSTTAKRSGAKPPRTKKAV